jgi:UDP-N-acetylmuramoyl-L-alanyl-D-glutamate--2,6-diaminopimelate ligase
MIVSNKHSLSTLVVGMLADPSMLDKITLTGLTLDSRQVNVGYLFVSLSLDKQQSEKHLKQALKLGAAAVLYDARQALSEQETLALAQVNVTAYPIKDLADKVSEIAARFYGHPSLAMTIIAVTGTNGKTSVSQFIAQGLEFLGKPCGVIGTLGVGRINDLQITGMTTPDPIRLQAELADLCQQSIKYVVVEASSHALEQGRLNSIDIDVAVLTNLSRDHLDYHQDMASYAAAKQRLFDMENIKVAIINNDDDFGRLLISKLVKRENLNLMTYSSQGTGKATLQACGVNSKLDGLEFVLADELVSSVIHSGLLGKFNVDNLLATAASLLAIDITFGDVANALPHCQAIDGRMQSYGGKDQPHIVIDFAHSPDALEQALKSLRAHLTNNGQLWCVFGCGGDRDIGKRSVMGRTAELYADRIVISDDNPRTEVADDIIDQILGGIKQAEKVHIEHDRQLAITYAVTHAKNIDIVLVAGKGHEQYQEVDGVKYDFNDAIVVKHILQAANNSTQLLKRFEL